MRQQGRTANSKQRQLILKGKTMGEKTEKAEKKQLLLRLSQSLWNDINKWAEDEFRSINGQIEYILTEAVKKRKSGKNAE